jgi:DNA invertase Pin-like site-specific DNA recombinase
MLGHVTNAAIYVRISQDREGAGLGVQRQEQDCRKLAEALRYQVVGVYSDNDISAYSGKVRPEYRRLLDDIRSGHVKALLVWHTDRLHRSPLELETFIQVADGIPTHSVTAGQLDLTKSSGRMAARIAGAVARNESEHKSERQRRKADELAAKGLPLGGGRPFGYEADGMTVRQAEADELRGMVTKVLAGESLNSILRDLNARSVATTRGGRWGYPSLRALLLRERNCGRMRHRGEVIGAAAWEPIISETDHDAVAAVLADPSRRTTTSPARKHLLSGLLRCGGCGSAMKAGWVSSRGKRYNMYRCPERGAGHVHRNMEKVDDYVTKRVLRQLGAVLFMPREVDTSALEVQRDAIKMRQDEMAVMYGNGLITAAQLSAFTASTTTRLSEITDELSQAVIGNTLDGVSGMSEDQWNALSLDRKRTIIDALMILTVEPVKHGPLPHNAGVAVKLRSDQTPGTRTTTFGFTMPTETVQKIRAAASSRS